MRLNSILVPFLCSFSFSDTDDDDDCDVEVDEGMLREDKSRVDESSGRKGV